MITFADRKGGFPHSEIAGSKGARASPALIAACHVLHRLSMPRHPSEALMRLIVLSKTHAWGRCLPRYEARQAPTHALCLCFDDDVISDPSSNPRGGADEPFNSRCQMPQPAGAGAETRCFPRSRGEWWSQTGSNRRPHACKARALPTELWPLNLRGGYSWEPSSIRRPPARGSHNGRVWWAQADSNCRPHAYQACALTN